MPYGKHYALYLKNGKGKTAIARMLLGFIEHNSGKILLSGVEYQNYNTKSIRKQFSYVAQEPAMLEGSIAENITMFEKKDMQKLQNAIKVCGLEDVLKRFKGGYNQNTHEKGIYLLNQERQKICLARAVYRNAPVLLLDCPFNKFTQQETTQLLQNLLQEYKGKTVIFLTDNKKLLPLFDEVVNLGKGGGK